ncbi:MAG: HAD hydrolase-like protein [Pseudomonadota bacterium]
MAICFDLDGTLTDPKQGIFRCIRYALHALDVETPDDAALKSFIGPPLVDSFVTLLGDRAQADVAVQLYRQRFSEVGLFENQIYAGIPDVLRHLKAENHSLFVATSKPVIFAEKIINHFGLSSYFKAVYGSELDGTRSDKTELLSWIVEREHLQPKTCFMVGDRMHDMLGAKNTGMAAIGVLYGYGSPAELQHAGAERLCHKPRDLLQVFCRL